MHGGPFITYSLKSGWLNNKYILSIPHLPKLLCTICLVFDFNYTLNSIVSSLRSCAIVSANLHLANIGIFSQKKTIA